MVVLIWTGALTSVQTPVMASPLYKCVGSDGIPQYVQKKPSASTCSVVKPAPPPPSKPFVPVVHSGSSNAPSGSPAKPAVNQFTTPPVDVTPSPPLLPPGMPPRSLPPLPSDFKSG